MGFERRSAHIHFFRALVVFSAAVRFFFRKVTMPPKKFQWKDIPHQNHVKNKDDLGKWIECAICNITIRIRAQYGFTEWKTHCEGVKHCKLINGNDPNNASKITSHFKNSPKAPCSILQDVLAPKGKVAQTCPGFSYGKNSEFVALYSKYKRKDALNDSISIRYEDGKWTVHSKDCTNVMIPSRASQRSDRYACEKCFTYSGRQMIKERIKRMHKIMIVEQYLTEHKPSETGSIAVTKFLKTNVKTASPNTLDLMKRCRQYLEHQTWLKKHIVKLQQYDQKDKTTKTTKPEIQKTDATVIKGDGTVIL